MELASNKKAFFDYEILEKLETGIILRGSEVKAVRGKQISLADSFVKIEKGELVLWNATINQYKYSSEKDYDPIRTRKLLAKKEEIYKLESKMKQGRLTLVPLRFYTAGRRIKLEIGLARGKKQYEKKDKLKERTLERELHRDKRDFMV